MTSSTVEMLALAMSSPPSSPTMTSSTVEMLALAMSSSPTSPTMTSSTVEMLALAMSSSPTSQELLRERLDGCEDSGRRYEVVPSVVCSMCCLFGVIYCFFGYRCFKAVLFLTGLMFGSVVIFTLCYKERVLDAQLSAEAAAGVGLGVGTLCGLVTMLVRSVGLFMVGVLLGLLCALACLVGMEELSGSPPRSVWVPLGVLLGLGMLFAVLTLQWPRLFVTLSTSAFGAAVITVALDYFLELFALVLYMYERVKAAARLAPVCWVTWTLLAVWPALTLLGVAVQWKVTAEGYSHTKVIISRQQRRMQVMRIRQKEDRSGRKKKKKGGGASTSHHQAKAPEPAYRRKPNPIRRYDGDVLSPSYIQNFRERQMEEARPFPSSRLMGGPHSMVEVDYDCGSTAPLTGGANPGPSLRI